MRRKKLLEDGLTDYRRTSPRPHNEIDSLVWKDAATHLLTFLHDGVSAEMP